MSDTTANLEMPYILPSQAQKHVTHNEALQRLDALTQLVVTAALAAPPPAPPEGACYAVSAAPTGAWSGKAGRIAFRQDGAWIFMTPRAGWRAFFLGDQRLRIHDGAGWQNYDALAGLAMLGIHATADTVNRLAVAADATLLNHDGHGHQVKINKAAAGETASLLFQSGFSGRAEMGLSGSDAFSVKVSPDGSAWLTALTMSGSGHVTTPHRPLARATRGGGLVAPSNGSQTGFTVLSVAQGGFALGSPVAGGGSALVVPATAAYLVALRVDADPSAAFSVGVRVNGTTTIATLRETDGSAALHGAGALGIAFLAAGDTLTLAHTGSATLDFGYDKTELLIAML